MAALLPAPTLSRLQDAIEWIGEELIDRHVVMPEEAARPESRLVEDLNLDSLDALDLVLSANEAFGVEIPPEATDRMATIGGFGEVLWEHWQRKGAAPQALAAE